MGSVVLANRHSNESECFMRPFEDPNDIMMISETGGGDSGAVAAVMVVFALMFAAVGLILYVINAIFLSKLLKAAGHKQPVSAWVPVWSTVSLMEIGGIRKPWIWALLLVGSSLVSGIPVLGWFISVAALVVAVMLYIWIARGVHAGLGMESTGGIVLAVLVPVAWVIWMSIVAGKTAGYNRYAALSTGASFPLNKFGEGEPEKAFL